MTARHWIQIVALSSALGLTGAAIAQNMEGTTSTEDRAGVTSPGVETPSAGAIVTPEDKALGMGQDGSRSDVLGDDLDDNAVTADDDELGINSGPSNDESSANPGLSDDEDLSVNPGS
jgi:hypothetical protein